MSLDDLHDLTQVRQQIEALCVRSAIAHGDVERETRVAAALHRMALKTRGTLHLRTKSRSA